MTNLTIENKREYFKLMGGRFQQHFDYFNATVQTESDLDKFYSIFDGEVVKSILVFRQQKIKQLNVTLDQFISLYEEDEKGAIELLFQQTIRDFHLDVVLNNSGITPVDLYNKFKISTGHNLISLINNFDTIGKEKSDDSCLFAI